MLFQTLRNIAVRNDDFCIRAAVARRIAWGAADRETAFCRWVAGGIHMNWEILSYHVLVKTVAGNEKDQKEKDEEEIIRFLVHEDSIPCVRIQAFLLVDAPPSSSLRASFSYSGIS